jgi:hypothetical protein
LIDNGDMLAIANQIVASQTQRGLMASSARRALWILRKLRVDSVVIRHGVAGWRQVESECGARGVAVYHMTGNVESGIIRMTFPRLSRRAAGAMERKVWVRRCRPAKCSTMYF